LIRSERDRRVDEILSSASRSSTPERYHDEPSPPSSASSYTVNNNEQGDSMKLKPNLASFGGSMKHKLGGLFSSTKTASTPQQARPLPTPQLERPSSPPTGGGRVFGRPVINENHRPYGRNIVDQNGYESPNPFLAAANRQPNSNVSPFARFNDNIFDDI
jgi:hypothetical protein